MRSRSLTPGERKIIASVFGAAIDPGPVRIHRRKWWPFQPRETLMAPCGHLHVPAKSDLWSDDYSAEDVKLQGLFVHEMTHVWQAQAKGRFYLPLMRHPFCRYAYRLEPAVLRNMGSSSRRRSPPAFLRACWTDSARRRSPPRKVLPSAAQAASLARARGRRMTEARSTPSASTFVWLRGTMACGQVAGLPGWWAPSRPAGRSRLTGSTWAPLVSVPAVVIVIVKCIQNLAAATI